MATNQPTPTKKPPTLASAMMWVGGIAGFLWGGGIGGEDPEIGFWAGALVGAGMGVGLGWGASMALRVIFNVAFLALGLLLIAGRVYWLFNVGGAS